MNARLNRLRAFVGAVFPPPVYGSYAILWTLALESCATVLGGHAWRPTVGTPVRAASVLLALLYLRIVDEQKDLDYDRVHHPERPLVRGDITVPELHTAMAAIGAVLVALNLRHPVALTVLLAMLAYAIGLVFLERHSAPVRGNVFLNLAVTYPVQLLLSCYLYLSTGQPVRASGAALIAVFMCVFLHFEFARKTAWWTPPGSRCYSGPLGPLGSAAAAVGWALVAAALTAAVLRPWQVGGLRSAALLLPLTLPLAGLVRFVRRRPAAWPVPLGMAFVVTSYLSLTLQAAAS